MWSTKSFLGDIYYNLNKIKQNSKYFQSKKIHSSSMDKNIFPITKLTKTPFRKFFKKKNNNTSNNTIDINISVNYLNKGKSQDNSLHNSSKYPKTFISNSNHYLDKKITSYISKQPSNKRNKNKNINDLSDSHIIHNNLNISLTNFGSPKEDNSFINNPILLGKTIDERKFKFKNSFSNSGSSNLIYRGILKNNFINNNKHYNSIKDLSFYNLKKEFNYKNNDFNIKSNDLNNNKNNNDLNNNKNNNDLNIDKNNEFNMIKKNMNEEIQKIKNDEKDLSKINDKIYIIIQSYFTQFCNLLQQNEKDVALNFIFHINEMILSKKKEISELTKSNKELEKKFNDLKNNNNSFMNENIQLKEKLENVINKFNNNLNTNFSKFEVNNNNNILNKSIEETESSVNTDDLESIRFFDKIYMKRNSFSNSHIPNLNLNFSLISQHKNQKPIHNSVYNVKNNNGNNYLNKIQYKSKGYSSIADIKKNYLFYYLKK